MHAYTLTGSTTITYKHRIDDSKFLPQAKSPMNLPLVLASTGILAFLREPTDNQSQVIKSLENKHLGKSRNWLAKACRRGRETIQRDLDALIALGKVSCVESQRDGRTIRVYQLTTPANPIRRSPCYHWKRCPVCNTDRRLRRLPDGTWLHWCGEHHSEVLSREVVG